jgi:hypothetical protein
MIAVLAGLVAILSYVPYVRQILVGNVRPQRASWLIWAVLTCIAFISLLAKGAGGSVWLPALAGLGAIVVFALSVRFGIGGLRHRDTIALMIAAAGLLAWWLTRNAAYALLFTIGVDAIAGVLTACKAFEHPETESYTAYVMMSAAGLLSTVSVGRFDTIVVIYPLYVWLVSLSIVAAMFAGRRFRRPARYT